jgi:Tfp pilus assembly pilus retraction ATPase PilT
MVTMEQSLKGLHDRGLIGYDEALEAAYDTRELNRLMGRS